MGVPVAPFVCAEVSNLMNLRRERIIFLKLQPLRSRLIATSPYVLRTTE